MNFAYYGGRRFIMCMGCAIVCTILVWFGKITGGEFVTVILGTVAAFITGNTISDKVQTNNEYERSDKDSNS